MKRGRHDFLSDAQAAELLRLRRAGVTRMALATQFNLSTRSVDRRIALLEGHVPQNRLVKNRHKPTRICLIERCEAEPEAGQVLCEAHRAPAVVSTYQSSIAPPTKARLMAGR